MAVEMKSAWSVTSLRKCSTSPQVQPDAGGEGVGPGLVGHEPLEDQGGTDAVADAVEADEVAVAGVP